jgi:hypothetical protein
MSRFSYTEEPEMSRFFIPKIWSPYLSSFSRIFTTTAPLLNVPVFFHTSRSSGSASAAYSRGSNLGPETGYLEVLNGFPQYLQANAVIVF